MSYHINLIPPGKLGEISKIKEELAELEDAVEQGSSVMAIVELSDMVGAIDAYLREHHPDTTMEDLIKFSEITKRAFVSGSRPSKSSRWTHYKQLNYDFLKKHCKEIHYFGLGFIQLKLNENERLHFYHPKLDPFTDEIHNHRYDFNSTVLRGSIENETFRISEFGSSNALEVIVTDESCDSAKPANNNKRLAKAASQSFHRVPQGSSYFMSHKEFHKVTTGESTITYLVRGPKVKEFAQVAWKLESERVCPFSRNLPEVVLWAYVREMLND